MDEPTCPECAERWVAAHSADQPEQVEEGYPYCTSCGCRCGECDTTRIEALAAAIDKAMALMRDTKMSTAHRVLYEARVALSPDYYDPREDVEGTFGP